MAYHLDGNPADPTNVLLVGASSTVGMTLTPHQA
jgi:hypothetical protein